MKYKIIASEKDLKFIGINKDDIELEGEFLLDMGDGWICLEVPLKNKLGLTTYNYDFPESYIELI